MKNSGVTTNMGWERWQEWKCIFAEQWEELYWEFVRFLSLIWSQPIYAAYIVFFAPGLLRMVVFFCPLIISTCLFVLVIFSFGPQLDRVRVESDLQWEGFKEAVVGSMGNGDGDGYRRFRVLRGVKRPGRCSTDWLKCLNEDACQSILYAEGQLHDDIEEESLKVEIENQEGGVAMAENKSLGSSHSVISSKIAVLLERLIADLGGRVEFDVLYALEAIAQIFIETTLRQFETETIKSSNSGFAAAQNQQSNDGKFDKTEHIGECSVIGKSVSVNAENVDRRVTQIFIETTLRQHETETIKSSDSSFAAAQNQQSDDRKFEKTEHIGECSVVGESVSVNSDKVDRREQGIELTECMPHGGGINAESVGMAPTECMPHGGGINAESVSMAPTECMPHGEGINASKALNGELDRIICDVGTVHGNVFESTTVIPESSIVVSYPRKLSEISQASDKHEGSLSSVATGGDASESRDENGLPGLDKCVFRSCRSFPVDSSEEGLHDMDKLWEAENNFARFAMEKSPSVRKGKDWKRTLACKLYEEKQNSWKGTLAGKFYEDQTEGSTRFRGQLSSSSGRIPQHQNYADFLVGKFTNSSSESRVLTPAESPLNAEEMDLLWEEYNDAPNHAPGSPIKGLAKGLAKLRSLRGNMDSDAEDGPETPQLCCLRAFRFSTGKIRKPNLVKISKALKNFGLIQQIRGPKQNTT